MTELKLTPNIEQPDEFYAALIAAHEGLTEEDSAALNARIILIMANQIGCHNVLTDIIDAARARR